MRHGIIFQLELGLLSVMDKKKKNKEINVSKIK
jgi:hypothetical protein